MTDLMRTKDRFTKELYEERTPIVDACRKVQLSTKGKNEAGRFEYKTEVIEMPCKRIDGDRCAACAFPDLKWHLGVCNMASHLNFEPKKGDPHQFVTPITIEVEEYKENKTFINPIKKSKRSHR